MKKYLLMLILLIVSAGLVACSEGSSTEIKDDKNVEAKVSDDNEGDSDKADEEETESEEDAEDSDDEDSPWTYFETDWSEEFNGLEIEIEFVGVSDSVPAADYADDDEDLSAVGAKFIIENTTDHKFATYPDQATLVTSTGEQVEADMIESESVGGDIDKGVIKEGVVIWFLERGEAESIEWIKLDWFATDAELEEDGDYEEMMHDFTAEIELK